MIGVVGGHSKGMLALAIAKILSAGAYANPMHLASAARNFIGGKGATSGGWRGSQPYKFDGCSDETRDELIAKAKRKRRRKQGKRLAAAYSGGFTKATLGWNQRLAYG